MFLWLGDFGPHEVLHGQRAQRLVLCGDDLQHGPISDLPLLIDIDSIARPVHEVAAALGDNGDNAAALRLTARRYLCGTDTQAGLRYCRD